MLQQGVLLEMLQHCVFYVTGMIINVYDYTTKVTLTAYIREKQSMPTQWALSRLASLSTLKLNTMLMKIH